MLQSGAAVCFENCDISRPGSTVLCKGKLSPRSEGLELLFVFLFYFKHLNQIAPDSAQNFAKVQWRSL